MDEAQQRRLEAEHFDRLADLGVSFEESLDGKWLEKDEDPQGLRMMHCYSGVLIQPVLFESAFLGVQLPIG